MSIIDWPTGLRPGDGSGFGQARFDVLFGSESTGAQQARVLGPPRWTLQILQPPALQAEAAGQWQALLIGLRGKVNHLRVWDFGAPLPMGTLRGTLGFAAPAAKGATSILIGGAGDGKTILAGDRLQLGTGLGTSQVVMCMAPAVSAGNTVTVQIEPPLRSAFAGDTVISWNRPVAYFKLTNSASNWTYETAARPLMRGASLDLIEVWS